MPQTIEQDTEIFNFYGTDGQDYAGTGLSERKDEAVQFPVRNLVTRNEATEITAVEYADGEAIRLESALRAHADQLLDLWPDQPGIRIVRSGEHKTYFDVYRSDPGYAIGRQSTMKVDGEPMSVVQLLKRIRGRSFGLIYYSKARGSCRVRLIGESDADAVPVTQANEDQLTLLAANAEWVRRSGFDRKN